MRTTEYIQPPFKPVTERFGAAGGNRAVAEAIFGVRAEYLQASFAQIQKDDGSIEKYLAEGLNTDATGQQAPKTPWHTIVA